MTINEYLGLITSEYRDQPNFTAMTSLDTSLPVRVQELMASMVPIFDVDVAVGEQLDVIGQWVGVSRNVSLPLASVFFSWDGAASLGWEYGSWQPSFAPTSVTSLPDDVYRTLIKAKIAANRWDGTTTGAYEIWDSLFSQFTILIQDNQNMTYAFAVIGGIVDTLTLALITGGYIPLKPEGVLVSAYYVSVDTNPVFCWDVESTLLKGWDEASWVQELAPT